MVGQWNEEEEIAKLTGPQITYFGSDDIGVPSTKLLVPLAGTIANARMTWNDWVGESWKYRAMFMSHFCRILQALKRSARYC